MKKFILITLAGSALNFPVLADDINEMNAKSEQLGLIGVDEAKSIALEAKPGIIDDIDLDNRSFVGGWDYEIEVLGKDGKEKKISPTTTR